MYLEWHFDFMPASPFTTAATPLYLICDGEACGSRGMTITDFMRGAVGAGAGLIQYRHKNITEEQYAENLAELSGICKGSRSVIVVNDYANVAEKFLLPLHLGQDDVLPPGLSVPYGRSTHNFAELEIALAADPKPGYVALGTMFSSTTKPGIRPARELVEEYLERTELPLVLIGGITLENAAELPTSDRIFYAIIGDAFRFGATETGIAQYVNVWLRKRL